MSHQASRGLVISATQLQRATTSYNQLGDMSHGAPARCSQLQPARQHESLNREELPPTTAV
eukprot:8230905-Alexandrium_andersonii.AAC.1